MTRHWPCLWQVNLSLSNGPIFGAFVNRTKAIDAEIEWLDENVFGGKLNAEWEKL